MTTAEGLEYALPYVNMPDAGCVTLFGNLPYAWGSSWQNTRWHARGQGPSHTEDKAGRYRQVELLLANFLALARADTAKDGFIIF